MAANDAYSVAQNLTLNIPTPGVLSNDTDVDGDTLTAILVSEPGSGSLVLYGDGSFNYTPSTDFIGIITFSYKAHDGTTVSTPVNVAITVNPAPTSTQSPTATPTLTFTPTPTSTPTPVPTSTPTPTQSPTATATHMPTPAPTPSATPIPTSTSLVDISQVSINGGPAVGSNGKIQAGVKLTGGYVPIEVGVATCPGGSEPTAVKALLTDYDGSTYTVSLTRDEAGRWVANWAAPAGPNRSKITVEVQASCSGETFAQEIGTITRYDPSGIITDATAGCTIMGATVILQRSTSSTPNGPWTLANPADREGGIAIMDPQVNPQFSDASGYYGWDVVAGWWRVVVTHPGYASQTSRAVQVPPPVLDLHVALTPTGLAGSGCSGFILLPTPTPAPVPSGGGGGGGGGGSSPPQAMPTPTSAPTPGFSGLITSSGGLLSTTDGKVRVSFPPQAISMSISATVQLAKTTPLPQCEPVSQNPSGVLQRILHWLKGRVASLSEAEDVSAQLPEGMVQGSSAFRLKTTDIQGTPITEFVQPVSLAVRYESGDLIRTGNDPFKLKLMRLKDDNEWQDLGAVVDLEKGRVEGTSMESGLFVIAIELPNPRLLAPSDGYLAFDFAPLTRWTIPPCTTQYHIQVIPFNNDGLAINLVRNIESSYQVKAPVMGIGNYVILPGMTYTWRVRTTTVNVALGEYDSRWSKWASLKFKTAYPWAGSISLGALGNGAMVNSLTPTLQWRDDDKRIFYYEVQISKDPAFNMDPSTAIAAVYWELAHGGVTNPLNSYTVRKEYALEPNTLYYWRVRPRIQGDGIPISWLETWRFKTP